jgi:hypothetical protein
MQDTIPTDVYDDLDSEAASVVIPHATQVAVPLPPRHTTGRPARGGSAGTRCESVKGGAVPESSTACSRISRTPRGPRG